MPKGTTERLAEEAHERSEVPQGTAVLQPVARCSEDVLALPTWVSIFSPGAENVGWELVLYRKPAVHRFLFIYPLTCRLKNSSQMKELQVLLST